MRVAAIDCGTNSIRLLVADLAAGHGGSPLTEVLRRMEIVRLGCGVDRTGRIAPEAMARTLAMAREYAVQCDDLGVERVRFVATSASRDAANAAEFVAGVRAAFTGRDVTPEVVTGDEEAYLSFVGATGELQAAGCCAPFLVVDLGGGSTEFVLGAARVEAVSSVGIGCVRLAERHLSADPPGAAGLAAATAEVDTVLDTVAGSVDLAGVGTLVGLAGTVTTVAAHALGLTSYERDVIHLSRIPVDAVLAACDDLVHASRDERAALGFMHPGRVDVIGAGALVWARIVARVAAASGLTEVVASEHDILDGIALGLA